jgi:transcriptional regulator with XRE-family HTH domain
MPRSADSPADRQRQLAGFIRRVRTQAGLSQVRLAALLQVRQSAISQWERATHQPTGGHLFTLLIDLAPVSTTVLADYTDQQARTEPDRPGQGSALPNPAAAQPPIHH